MADTIVEKEGVALATDKFSHEKVYMHVHVRAVNGGTPKVTTICGNCKATINEAMPRRYLLLETLHADFNTLVCQSCYRSHVQD